MQKVKDAPTTQSARSLPAQCWFSDSSSENPDLIPLKLSAYVHTK